MTDRNNNPQIRVHRDILPEDRPSSSAFSSRVTTKRSTSAPHVRQVNPLPGNLSNLGRTFGRTISLAPEWQQQYRPLPPPPPQQIQQQLQQLQQDQQQQQGTPDDNTLTLEEEAASLEAPILPPTPQTLAEEVPLQYQGPGQRVRVRCWCIGDSFDRLLLQEQIIKRSRTTSVRAFAEVLCSVYNRTDATATLGDVFYFDFGCVVFWGLDKEAEIHVLKEIAQPCLMHAYTPSSWEKDRVWMLYTQSPKVVIEDDVLNLHYGHAADLNVKLAISFALAQSTKLSVFEEQMRCLGKELSFLPKAMAEVGDVPVSEKRILQHSGELYCFVSEVNLLQGVLDMPDLVYEFPTNIKSLYKSVYEYMELEDRIQLLNDRFAVIREMLSILRTHVAQSKFAHLEAIVMWLVLLCAVLALFQLIAFLGWKPKWRDGGGGADAPAPSLYLDL